MSIGARIGLVAGLIVVVIAAFVIVDPGGDGGSSGSSGDAGSSAAQPRGRDAGPTAKAEAAKPPPPTKLALAGHQAKGDVQTIEARKGDTVRFDVTSDAPDDVHLHGYDVEKRVAPGKPARFRIKAGIEGEFEIESHEAEHVGKEPLIAKLVVRPS